MNMPSENEFLPGRDEALQVSEQHYVNGNTVKAPYPSNMKQIIFGLGCFWGAEKKYWELDGVHSTSAGYAAGSTKNPTYQEVCSGQTGHNEVVLVIYDPEIISYQSLINVFFETHDPTQGMRQGNDKGTQYRSGIYTSDKTEQEIARATKKSYQQKLNEKGFDNITTEISDEPVFYFAEDYHQQYLAKNPGGYCGLGGTGITCTE